MIYLDNAATTRLSPEVLESMMPFLQGAYGNASAVYSFGKESRKAIEDAREKISACLNAEPEEIYFTSCGTESDNWALRGICRLYPEKKVHIITTMIEHPAILETCAELEKSGLAEVTYLKPDRDGNVYPDQVEQAVRQETVLVSVMHANNEIGTVQNIRKIGEIAHAHHIWMHMDAVQSFAHLPIDAQTDSFDLLSASGHKFNGPKGIGFLYISKKLNLPPLITGGGQERHRRAGTENTASIVGMGRAAEIAVRDMKQRTETEKRLRDLLYRKICEKIPGVHLHGAMENRLPNNLNLAFPGIDAEEMLLFLNRFGICASAGSACSAGDLQPSHVLLAAGYSRKEALESVRFTVSHENTEEEITEAAEKIVLAAERLSGRC